MVDSRQKVGFLVSLVAGLIGVGGSFGLFLTGYKGLIAAELATGNASGAKMLTLVYPAMSDLGVISGVIFLVAAYGFGTSKRWAWPLAVCANAGALLSSFIPMMWPLMIHKPPLHVALFLPLLLAYSILLLYVRPVGWRLFLLSLFAGITMVLNFMNGVAGLNKLIATGQPLFLGTQQLSWIAATAWGVFAVAVLFRQSWALPVGIGAGVMAVFSGAPLAIMGSMQKGRLSLFAPGPFLALILLILLLIYGEQLYRAAASARGDGRPTVSNGGFPMG